MAEASSEQEPMDFPIRTACQRMFDPGDTVFDQGDSGDNLYVIQSGEIELSRAGEAGHRIVARLGPGAFFGEQGAVLDGPRTTRAVAASRTCLLELDRATLEAMCLAEPAIAIRMIRMLVSRLMEAERRLTALGIDDLLRPIVRGLVRNAEPDAEFGNRIPSTLRSLAQDAGLSMLETHRALHPLFDQKVIRLVKDRLFVPDLEALSAALESSS